jgi:Cytochrome P460
MPNPAKAVLVGLLCLSCSTVLAQTDLGIAQYTADGQLQYPTNLKEWIQTGASLGSEYGEAPFDPQNPGSIGVVQMEPAAYRYFLEHKTYADGTMFLLSFYQAEGKSEPQLPGFVQGPLRAQEIHVIDKQRFGEKQAFFMFPVSAQTVASKVPDGSECVSCHIEHGQFESTFVQFYPDLRAHLGMTTTE